MTIDDIRKAIKTRYKIGQKVPMKLKNVDMPGVNSVKVTILAFNTNSVLVDRKGFKESYQYWEFMKLTSDIKEIKLENEKGGYHKNKAVS